MKTNIYSNLMQLYLYLILYIFYDTINYKKIFYKLYNFTQYKKNWYSKKFHIKKFIKSSIILYDLKNIKINYFL